MSSRRTWPDVSGFGAGGRGQGLRNVGLFWKLAEARNRVSLRSSEGVKSADISLLASDAHFRL